MEKKDRRLVTLTLFEKDEIHYDFMAGGQAIHRDGTAHNRGAMQALVSREDWLSQPETLAYLTLLAWKKNIEADTGKMSVQE